MNVGSDRYGIKFGDNNELEFIWEEVVFPTNHVVTNNTWTQVTLTIAPTTASLCIIPIGGALDCESVPGTYPSIAMTDILMFGDGGGADFDVSPPFLPYFKGRMDNIRIINQTLSMSEITLLGQQKYGGKNPVPYHTQAVADGSLSLQWTPSPAAKNQKLFVSTDYNAVKNEMASAEQSGILSTTNSFQLTSASGSTFWKVVTTESNDSIHPGSIWNFFAGSKNHSGSCNGLINTCYAVEAPTGIASDGTKIFALGTTGPVESNWSFLQSNASNCGDPVQCFAANSFAGNNSTLSLAYLNNLTIASTSAGLTAYAHSGITPCQESWSIEGEFGGLVAHGNRVFITEGNEIHEIDPTDGQIIASTAITGVTSVLRMASGPGSILYFSHVQFGTMGGVGMFDVDLETFSLLPGAGGSGLQNPSGLTVDAAGDVLIAEKDQRRIAAINIMTGTVSTYVEGLVAPSDVMLLGGTLYIADEGGDQVLAITCGSGPCPTSLTLSGTNDGGGTNSNKMVNNVASGDIISTQIIESNTQSIIYDSGSEILLQPNFEVRIPIPAPASGSLLEIKTEGCN